MDIGGWQASVATEDFVRDEFNSPSKFFSTTTNTTIAIAIAIATTTKMPGKDDKKSWDQYRPFGRPSAVFQVAVPEVTNSAQRRAFLKAFFIWLVPDYVDAHFDNVSKGISDGVCKQRVALRQPLGATALAFKVDKGMWIHFFAGTLGVPMEQVPDWPWANQTTACFSSDGVTPAYMAMLEATLADEARQAEASKKSSEQGCSERTPVRTQSPNLLTPAPRLQESTAPTSKESDRLERLFGMETKNNCWKALIPRTGLEPNLVQVLFADAFKISLPQCLRNDNFVGSDVLSRLPLAPRAVDTEITRDVEGRPAMVRLNFAAGWSEHTGPAARNALVKHWNAILCWIVQGLTGNPMPLDTWCKSDHYTQSWRATDDEMMRVYDDLACLLL
ncbi:hypothetical protein HJFPF1_07639 [Paramyrothecium foliicola]|nr:hypothetical protein HJFPF1_07639 [Paramyrothecium foliicola]